jgi:hypothetical protein
MLIIRNSDKKHGKGKYTFQAGGFYDGTFQFGQIKGEGHFLYKSGNEYFGEMNHDAKVGVGKFLYLKYGSTIQGTSGHFWLG